MRQAFLLAAVVLVVGGYAAQFADRETASQPVPHAAAVQPAPSAPRASETYGRNLKLDADRQGHFQTQARVNGHYIGFVVDTGASLVVLRASDAGRVGIRPVPADFTQSVSTANGTIKAAPAKLDRIELGDISVSDVTALVLPDEALAQNLLGVSFLSRLKRYQVADGHMLLEQ